MTDRKPSRGVLTFAYGKDYQRMAFAQALSCRNHGVDMTVVVPVLEFPHLQEVANVVVFEDPVEKFEWELQAFRLSPYEVTLKTDADLLWPTDCFMEGYFGFVERIDIASGVACDLSGTLVECEIYRQKELELGWPTFYSAVWGFNKSPKAKQFFDRSFQIYENWWALNSKIGGLPFTTDSVLSLAYFMEYAKATIPHGLSFIHAKEGVCGPLMPDNWSASVPKAIDLNGNVYINNRKLSLPFHYYDKNFLSDVLLDRLIEIHQKRTA